MFDWVTDSAVNQDHLRTNFQRANREEFNTFVQLLWERKTRLITKHHHFTMSFYFCCYFFFQIRTIVKVIIEISTGARKCLKCLK